MKVVLDTNVLLVSISTKSPFHWIFEKFSKGQYSLCISHDMLLEYEEIVEKHMGAIVSKNLVEGLILNPKVIWLNYHFQWNLLQDPDDNKFVDCAISAGADYLVSQDRDFLPLQKIPFPKVNLVDIEMFKNILIQSNS